MTDPAGPPGAGEPLPALICIDVEPDPREVDRDRPEPPAGFEALLDRERVLRERLSEAAGAPARFAWFVRMDPQIELVYGSAAWLFDAYRAAFDALAGRGDEIGVHPHSWRWQGGRWVSDQADAAWVAHCMEVALGAYRKALGRPCVAYRHGDGFMSDALARGLEAAGVAVDLTVEPGRPAMRGLAAGEATTGWLPDTRTAPARAYHPSPGDFRVPDPARTDGLLIVPLTPEPLPGAPSGGRQVLRLWAHPARFRAMLWLRLRARSLGHLAFAIRSDAARLPGVWRAIEANLAEVGRQLEGRHRWCTPSEARARLDPYPAGARPPARRD
jgi:hypothetical protein